MRPTIRDSRLRKINEIHLMTSLKYLSEKIKLYFAEVKAWLN